MNRNEIYKVIYRELIAIVEGVEHKIANLANASALFLIA